jgi:hypothetical protein
MLADAAGLDASALSPSVSLVTTRAPSGSSSGSVRTSKDLTRILALPRRVWYEGRGGRWGTADQVREIAHAAFRRPGSSAELHLRQAVALQEIHDVRGAYVAIRVGGGKTLISLLAPRVLSAKRPVLLLPGSLRDKTLVERDKYAVDWDVPRVTTDPNDWNDGELLVLSFAQISLDRADDVIHGDDAAEVEDASAADGEGMDCSDEEALAAARKRPLLLDRLSPDLLLIDEADCLKHARSGRTRRVRRFVRAKRAEERAAQETHGTRLVCAFMTGTPANDSILEYAHLLDWALGPGSPLPLSFPVLREWADALDESSQSRRSVGALARLVPPEPGEQEKLRASPLSTVRRAYARRLVETPGVIAVASSDKVSARLSIRAQHLPMTSEQREAFEVLRKKWETPDGQPFSMAADLWRHAREVACGFYYRWVQRPPDAWMEARREWCRFVREALVKGARRGWDTELAVVRAIKRGELPSAALEDWRAVRDTFTPETEAVWLTQSVLEHAAEWLSTRPHGLCWVEHRCVGPALSRLSGVKYFGQGGKCGKIPIESHAGSAILSFGSNFRGRNLQHNWHENLILSLPERGAHWEQLLGRTHRDGQKADEVSIDLTIVCREQILGFQKALATAEFAAESSTMAQKLLDASVDVREPDPIPPGW